MTDAKTPSRHEDERVYVQFAASCEAALRDNRGVLVLASSDLTIEAVKRVEERRNSVEEPRYTPPPDFAPRTTSHTIMGVPIVIDDTVPVGEVKIEATWRPDGNQHSES